jgi:hypothetical protein
MSTETDVALMVELEEKINQRIQNGIYAAMNGHQPASQVSAEIVQAAVANLVKHRILNDNVFLTELAKRIGQRMQYLHS